MDICKLLAAGDYWQKQWKHESGNPVLEHLKGYNRVKAFIKQPLFLPPKIKNKRVKIEEEKAKKKKKIHQKWINYGWKILEKNTWPDTSIFQAALAIG